MTHLIYNCALYVILSSALPLLVKVLGITNFDLLGNYGKIRWLGNYILVFAVNALFGGEDQKLSLLLVLIWLIKHFRSCCSLSV